MTPQLYAAIAAFIAFVLGVGVGHISGTIKEAERWLASQCWKQQCELAEMLVQARLRIRDLEEELGARFSR